jgi:hypothetical protein
MNEDIKICIKSFDYNGNYFHVGDIINIENGYGNYKDYILLYSQDYEYYMGCVDPALIKNNFVYEKDIIDIDKKFMKIIYE